jgi:hypothetical protein
MTSDRELLTMDRERSLVRFATSYLELETWSLSPVEPRFQREVPQLPLAANRNPRRSTSMEFGR